MFVSSVIPFLCILFQEYVFCILNGFILLYSTTGKLILFKNHIRVLPRISQSGGKYSGKGSS